MDRLLHVTFGVHVPEDSMRSLLTGLGAAGNVRAMDKTNRQYEVTVLHEAHVPHLQKKLLQWEQYGFLRYEWVAP